MIALREQTSALSAISLKKVTKAFCPDRRRSCRYAFADAMNPAWVLGRPRKIRPDEKIVLEDISLELQPGECLAIIGRKHSGKSTLAKIVAGTLPADRGSVDVDGDLLLINSVGKTFKPMLTIYENAVFGVIALGEPTSQAKQKAEWILEFAGLTEMRDHSLYNISGTHLKQLGIAIGLSVERPILIFDDVFVAGSPSFREKAANRIQELLVGRTALLLTSKESWAERFNAKKLYLHEGKIQETSPPIPLEEMEEEMEWAEEEEDTTLSEALAPVKKEPRPAAIKKLRMKDPVRIQNIQVDGSEADYIDLTILRQPGDSVRLSFEFEPLEDFECEEFELALLPAGIRLLAASIDLREKVAPQFKAGRHYKCEVDFQVPALRRGYYGVCIEMKRVGFPNPNLLKLCAFRLMEWTESAGKGAIPLPIQNLSLSEGN